MLFPSPSHNAPNADHFAFVGAATERRESFQ